ncbi:peptidoglycan editing factor PgeF [Hydrogenimonas sp.]
MNIHTLFTDRKGGASLPPYDTFNLAFHTGDDRAAVAKNRALLKERIGVETLHFMEQIHSDTVRIVDKSAGPLLRCDAIVTASFSNALVVMVADCIPILLYDEERGVIAAVHAGRNGTFKNISAKTVEVIHQEFGCRPERIKAKLGPSIHTCCYEVSEEMAQIAEKSFGKGYVNGRYLNLQRLNRDQLVKAGLHPGNIDISEICTCCSDRHFSYRREGITGRFAGVVWMSES